MRFPLPPKRFLLALPVAIVVAAVVVPYTKQPVPVCVASSGCDITVGSDPTHAAITGTGVYITNSTSTSVSIIDTRSNTVVKTVTVGDTPRYAVASGTGVYVLNQNGGTVSLIDRIRNVVTKTITVGTTPSGFAVTGTGLYISNSGGGTVSVIDLRTNTVAKTITVGTTPYSVTISGTGAYVNNFGTDNISVIDTVRNVVVKTIAVGDGPYASAASGTGMYIANLNAGTLSVVDTRTNTVSTTITTGTQSQYVAVTGTGVYVANYQDNNVSIIDRNRNSLVKNISVGTSPFWITISGTGVFVSNLNSSNVTIIDSVRTVAAVTVSTGTWPYFSAATGSTVYVPNKNPGTVTVLKQTTNAALPLCAVCGNGYVSGSEACDDGNTENGDGCSSSCTAEAGHTCSGNPSVCTSDCAAGVAPGAASSVHYNRTCYAYYTATTRNFGSAESACVSLGGHLAIASNAQIQSVLNTMGSYAWIGMTDATVEGTYTWVDGTPFSFTYWETGQPNGGSSENCGYMENAYRWHDYPCGEARQYFCQIRDGSHPPTTDGGGGMAAWLIDLRSRNGLSLNGQTLSSPIASPASPSNPQNNDSGEAANRSGGSGGGGTQSSSSSSMKRASQPEVPTFSENPFQIRTCSRVMKHFTNIHVLERLNSRLWKAFGFTCGARTSQR